MLLSPGVEDHLILTNKSGLFLTDSVTLNQTLIANWKGELIRNIYATANYLIWCTETGDLWVFNRNKNVPYEVKVTERCERVVFDPYASTIYWTSGRMVSCL